VTTATRLRAWAGRGPTLGIRGRFVLVVTAILAIVSLGISIFLPARTLTATMDSLTHEIRTIARISAYSVAPAVLFDDRRGAAEILARIEEATGVSSLVVVDEAGEAFAATADARSPTSLPDGEDPLRDQYRASSPIVHSGRTIGTVRVTASLAPLHSAVASIRRLSWVLAALSFGIGTAAALAFGSLVTRPLAAMADTARRIVAGEWSRRAPIGSDDEAGELARSMNEMLDRLQEARDGLQELNAALEQRVAARTAELELEVSERRRSEGALARANERFLLAAAALEGAIYDWDVALDRMTWSDGLARVFGYRLEQVRNAPDWWQGQVHPEDLDRVLRQRESGLARAEDFVCEYRFRHQDGHYLPVLDRGRVVAEPDGRVARVVGVIENVAELRRLEEQFLHSQRMEAVGRLAGGIAHDFNNILTTINGYSELLLDEPDLSPALLEQVTEIRKAGQRAADLTGQLLAFSRKEEAKPEVVDVRTAVLDLERMLLRLIGEDIRLESRLPAREACVMIERARLDQIIVNIAVNARDAMPNGGTLTLSVDDREIDDAFTRIHAGMRAGSYVRIEFRDVGTGMPPNVLARAFEPFFTTKPVGRGTGLGLSTVYGIVKQAGGYVSIESAQGKGTTVTVFLPRAPANDQAVADRAPDSRRAAGRILVVEDEESLRRMLSSLLVRNGYEVTVAGSGEEAIQLARETTAPHDLVLTDVVMPGVSGFSVMNELRHAQPDLKVVLMSGHHEEKVTRDRDLAPGTAFLNKPFALGDLLHTVEELLDRRPGESEPEPDPAA
jgi:PAS domain S-box-containing protein